MAVVIREPRRVLQAFAIGNLVPALVLGIACASLPLRWWVVDVPVALLVVGLVASSAIAFAKPVWARRALRVAAFALLAVGLALFAAFALSAAFLSGVHGAFGTFGAVLMVLVVFLLLPYAVIYPALELLLIQRLGASDTAPLDGASP